MNVARNTFWLTLEKAAHVGGALLLLAAVTRLLGEAAVAGYGAAVALTAFFMPFLDPGLTTRAIRAVAGPAEEGRPAVEAALAFKVRVALPVVCLMMGSAVLTGANSQVLGATFLIGLGMIAMGSGDCCNAIFKGIGRSDVGARLVAGLNVGLLVVALGAMAAGAGLVGVAAAHMVCRTAYLLVALFVARRVAPDYAPASLAKRVDRRTLIDGIRHLPPIYFLGNLLYVCYLVTYRIEGEVAAAPWVIGYRSASAVFVLAGAGFEAVLPAYRNRVSGGAGARRMLFAYAAWGVLAAVAMYVIAPVTPLLFGPEYVTAIGAIRTLALAVPALVLCGVAHTLLLGSGDARRAFVAILATLVVGSAAGITGGLLAGPEATALGAAGVSVLGGLAMGWMAVRLPERQPQEEA